MRRPRPSSRSRAWAVWLLVVLLVPTAGVLATRSAAAAGSLPYLGQTVATGSIPVGITYDAQTRQAFVANSASDNVTILSGVNNTEEGTLALSCSPYGIAYDAMNGNVYVACARAIAVIDASVATDPISYLALTVSDPVPWVTPDPYTGDLFVGNGEVLNGTNGHMIANLTALHGTLAGTFDPENAYLYFVGSEITVIDGRTESIVGTIPISLSHPRGANWTGAGIAYDPGDQDLYVTDQGANSVIVVNTLNNSVVNSGLPVGEWPAGITFDPATGYLYVADQAADMVSVLDADSGALVGNVTIGAGEPFDLALDSWTECVLATLTSSPGAVAVINGTEVPDQGITLQYPELPANPSALVYDPFNDDMYIGGTGVSSLVVYDALTDQQVGEVGPVFSTVSLAISTSSGWVYSLSQQPPIITVANTSDNEMLPQNQIGSDPTSTAIAYDPLMNAIWDVAADGWAYAFNATDSAPLFAEQIGSDLQSVAYDPNLGAMFLLDSPLDGQVDLIEMNATTGDYVATLSNGLPSTGGGGQVVADTQNGDLFVSEEWAGAVYEMDPYNGSVAETIWLGMPYGLTYDAGLNFLYVVDGMNGVLEINLANQQVTLVPYVTAWWDPTLQTVYYALGFDPEDGSLWVTDYEQGTVTVFPNPVDQTFVGISVDDYPSDVVYDAADGNVYSVGPDTLGLTLDNTNLNAWTNIYPVAEGSYVDVGVAAVAGPWNSIFVPAVTPSGATELGIYNPGSPSASKIALPAGGRPWGMTYDPETELLYLADSTCWNSHSDNVMIVNASTDVYVGNLSVTFGGSSCVPLSGIVYDALDNELFFVGNAAHPYVETLSASSRAVVGRLLDVGPGVACATVSAPVCADETAYDPINDNVYVIDQKAGEVTVISALADRIVANLSVGVDPVGIVFDSDNGYLYVANSGGANPQDVGLNMGNSVTVIDGDLDQVVTSGIPVGWQPAALTYDPANGNVYVANYGNMNISVFFGGGSLPGTAPTVRPWGEESQLIPLPGKDPVGEATEQGEVWVAVNGGSISNSGVVYLPTAGAYANEANNLEAVVNSQDQGVLPTGITYDSSNGLMYVVFGQGLAAFNSTGYETKAIAPPSGAGSFVKDVYSPASNTIFVAGYSSGLGLPTVYEYDPNAGHDGNSATWQTITLAAAGTISEMSYYASTVYLSIDTSPNWGSIVVIDAASPKVPQNYVPYGLGACYPQGGAGDPADGSIWVAMYCDSAIYTFVGDPSAGGAQETDVAYSPANPAFMYVTEYSANYLLVYPSNSAVANTPPVADLLLTSTGALFAEPGGAAGDLYVVLNVYGTGTPAIDLVTWPG